MVVTPFTSCTRYVRWRGADRHAKTPHTMTADNTAAPTETTESLRPWRVSKTDGIATAEPLDEDLDKEAVRAVAEWRFEPGKKDGKAVSMGDGQAWTLQDSNVLSLC